MFTTKKSQTMINRNNKRVYIYTNNNDNIVPFEIRRVVIQKGARIVKGSAFKMHSQLTSVTMPDSITNIGSCAFSGCRSLASIIIPNSVTTIGSCAFSGCSSLTSITIPDSATAIDLCAFSNCFSLASITIPNSVTTIGTCAFSGCRSLASIIIPNTVTTIYCEAFYGCSSLTSITIPNSVTTIERDAFSGCSSLASIIIPNSVTTIKSRAFFNCFSITSITIPDSVTIIDCEAFSGCSSLTSITIPNSVTTIGSCALSNCSSLTSITIPDSVTTIDRDAFYGCTQLYWNRRQSNGTNYHPDTRIWLQQRFANMPIHQVCYNNATQQDNFHTNILTNLILQASNDTTLALTDAMGMTALHVLCCNPNTTVDAIKLLKDTYPLAASMRNVAGMTPLMLLLQCNGLSYDELYAGRQTAAIPPLDRLLEVGVTNNVLEIILEAFDDKNELVLSLDTIDEASSLVPFMQAASLGCCALDVVYTLASKRPDLLRR